MEDIQDLVRIEKEEAFIKMLGSKGAKYVLEYLCEIQHHLVREDVRTEWYELTEKGQN
ncbi:MAG: hypothetical protein HXS54_14165 [Theionarchaea archaeon]|nr:hypothetical protein [Theionarchaea archaeon]